ncbi:MAG: hypothetical protein DSZ07_01595 [Sulfurovum sp.]|nr:MAG: hypothetical protein DSZ07_01595 [Sulfurovum sp.]
MYINYMTIFFYRSIWKF